MEAPVDARGVDGMLAGPNFESQKAMLEAVAPDTNIIASGGVASMGDIDRFREIAEAYCNLDGVIVGKALYDGRIDIDSLFV